jgi:DNA topoisomerase-1
MRLIISEKANTAKKIAQFLSEGPVKEGKHRSVPHHTFMWEGEETVSVGLKGHVLNPEYPEEYSNWQKVEPRELIDAEILKSVSEKGVAQAVTSLAKKADSVVIATDFDREGELIGVEALSLVFEANPKLTDHVQRARFSALTPGEVGRAFDELLEVSNDLADAGEARQDIDLIWGATLTRWVSRATKRYGSAFLSVGRVQSPTLVLIADRERERRAFIRHGHRRGDPAEVGDPQGAHALQHHGLPDGGLEHRVQPFEGGPPRRGPVHRRLHLLSQDGQHRLPALARPARGARLSEER